MKAKAKVVVVGGGVVGLALYIILQKKDGVMLF
jgi:glycine/D-amino acid oxidase-like deaminating enzyme